MFKTLSALLVTGFLITGAQAADTTYKVCLNSVQGNKNADTNPFPYVSFEATGVPHSFIKVESFKVNGDKATISGSFPLKSGAYYVNTPLSMTGDAKPAGGKLTGELTVGKKVIKDLVFSIQTHSSEVKPEGTVLGDYCGEIKI